MERKVVGQTATSGFQIGVRRTLAISPEEAWSFLMSEPGLKLWLGTFSSIQIEPKYSFESEEANIGEASKTTISFHQENLSDQQVREEMKLRWEDVLGKIRERHR